MFFDNKKGNETQYMMLGVSLAVLTFITFSTGYSFADTYRSSAETSEGYREFHNFVNAIREMKIGDNILEQVKIDDQSAIIIFPEDVDQVTVSAFEFKKEKEFLFTKPSEFNQKNTVCYFFKVEVKDDITESESIRCLDIGYLNVMGSSILPVELMSLRGALDGQKSQQSYISTLGNDYSKNFNNFYKQDPLEAVVIERGLLNSYEKDYYALNIDVVPVDSEPFIFVYSNSDVRDLVLVDKEHLNPTSGDYVYT